MMNRVCDFEKEKSAWLKAILPFLIIRHHCACMECYDVTFADGHSHLCNISFRLDKAINI